VAGRTPEDDEVADFLRGRGWQDLPLDWLARNHECMFFMTPEALRFYLPAFLLPSILDCGNAGDIPGSLLFLFETPSDPVRQSWFAERFGPLTARQRQAIKAFIEYVRDEHKETWHYEASVVLRSWT